MQTFLEKPHAILVVGPFLVALGAGCGDDSTGGGGSGSSTTSSTTASTGSAGTGGSGSTTSGSQAGAGGAGATSTSAGPGGGGEGGAGGGGGGGGAGGGGIEQLVGPEGGTVETQGVRVTIPEGALTEPVTIGIHRLDAAEIAALPGFDAIDGATAGALTPDVFAFTPHGTSFQVGVTIQLPATDGQTILRLDDEADPTWDLIPAVVDGGQATYTAYGFSIGAVANVEGTPGCDPDACAALGDEEAECVYMTFDYQGTEVGWGCSTPCTDDDQCSFPVACIDETTQMIYGWWCGIAPGHASGGCSGIAGESECHGSDGQNPNLTLCVDNECTDTPAG